MLIRLAVSAFTAAMAAVAPASAQSPNPPPLQAFATYDAVDTVRLAPDGEHLFVMRLPARNASYIVEVFDTSDFSEEPVRIGSREMEIVGARWVDDDHIWVTFRQQVRDRIEGVNQGVYEFKRAIVHRTGRGGFREMPDDARLVSTLPGEPGTIMVSTADLDYGEDLEGRAFSDVSTPDYYRYDVETLQRRMAIRGNNRLGGYDLDNEGNFRFATEVDVGSREVVYYTRDPGAETWRELIRFDLEDYEEFGQQGINVIGFDPDDSSLAIALAHNGANTIGVHLLDLDDGQFVDTLFRLDDVDILGWRDEPFIDEPTNVAGFSFYREGAVEVAWINEDIAALQASIDQAFPGYRNRIYDCVDGCDQMLVSSRGAQRPGDYYYIEDGEARFIGSANPIVEAEQLGEENFITYTARDGREIPGILTLPAFGEAPHPLVVVPHGGPWVSETRAYDEWAQVLASHGYMVLQPQYRGSEGYGLDHWLASWGQWGLTMQDDKDDGVRFLVEQGLADPDEAAMFGWSYGGYAAFAATVRDDPQPYQCTIAGAGVSDISRIQADFTQNRIGRQLIREGYRGLDPSEEAANANVPILVIHGEVDQRVPIYHSNRMVSELREHNKPYRYVVLEDADHFSNTIDFDNQMILYSELLNWLSGPCGMSTPGNEPGQFAETMGEAEAESMR